MARWSRRLTYFLLLVIWLILISLPFFAFTLSARKQFEFGSRQETYLRIFVIQEKDTEGLGIEYSRPSAANSACHQGGVRYYMWSGEGQNAAYCQCVDEQGQAQTATAGKCRPPDLYNP
jgi:hypothetical protein